MKRKRLLLALSLLLLSSPALGQVVRRDGQFGDKMYGDIARAGELDMYVTNVVRGSEIVVSLGPKGKTPYRATFFRQDGSLDGSLEILGPRDDFDSLLGPVLLKKEGRAVKSYPVAAPDTGPYRVLVSAAADDAGNPFGGEYSLRVKVRVPKRLSLTGTYDEAGMRDVGFDVLAGSVVTITLKAGPGSPLPEIADLLDPDGESLLDGLTIKTKKKSVQLKSVPLQKFGHHRLRIHAEGGGAWRASVKVRPPRRKPVVVENMDPEPPPLGPAELTHGLGEALCILRDEEGGANSFQTHPRYFLPGLWNPQSIYLGVDVPVAACTETLPVTVTTAPVAGSTTSSEPWVWVSAESGGPNDFTFRPGRTAPDWWVAATSSAENPVYEEDVLVGFTVTTNKYGYEATVTGITYTDDEDAFVTSFTAEVITPKGSGTSVISGVVRDPDGNVTGWTDDRTYHHHDGDLSYTVTIRDTVRAEGLTLSYVAEFTGPDGPHEPIPYPLVDESGAPVYYCLVCSEGYRLLFRDIEYTRTETLTLLANATIDVETPDGNGSSVLADILRDPAGRLLSWTETRTYAASGAVYTLDFFDVRRAEVPGGGFRTGETTGYRLDLTGPGGPLGTWSFPPWRLTLEEEAALAD